MVETPGLEASRSHTSVGSLQCRAGSQTTAWLQRGIRSQIHTQERFSYWMCEDQLF